MGRALSYLFLLLRIAAVVFAGGTVVNAFAEADPPGRVARLNYTEGNVAFAPAGEDEWTDASLNRPLVPGDKLWTDKGVRAEIQVGSAALRMDGRTRLTVLALDDRAAQLSVTQGTVYARVRNLPEGENFEIDTPNLAYRAAYPGDYRIDVDAQRGVTRVTVVSGTGAVYGDKGQALPLGGGQQITFKGRALEKVNVQESPPQDNFDRWAAERNRREDQSVAARYVPREVVGYQLLDASGEWRNDANYGPVWFPQGMAANWAPFRNGRWEWVAPWGWTWIDDAPWAFVTSHYGRWAQIGTRWAWAPGRLGVRPIYAPALVAFVGNGRAPLAIGGKPAVAWFPLAPGEAWQPAYAATPLYISSVNANMPPLKEGNYAYQRRPEAMTALSLDDFRHGRSSKQAQLRVAGSALANAQVIAPPGVPEDPKAAVAAAAPRAAPVVPEIQQVTASGPTLEQQIEARKQAEEQASLRAQRDAQAQRQRAAQVEQERVLREQQARAEQDKQAQEQKLAEQRRVAEQLHRAEQARRADQQKTAEQQQRLAEQTRRAEERKQVAQKQIQQQAQARTAEAARRTQAAKLAETRREAVLAKRAEQARRDVIARREREAKQERELQARRAQARSDEQLRKSAHAQQLDQARRAAEHDAQVLAQQRATREAQQRQAAEDKERAQRDAWQKQQQALAEQFKRDQQAWEEQQRAEQRAKAQRTRPDLRRTPPAEPEVWQRGIPILTPGRTS